MNDLKEIALILMISLALILSLSFNKSELFYKIEFDTGKALIYEVER